MKNPKPAPINAKMSKAQWGENPITKYDKPKHRPPIRTKPVSPKRGINLEAKAI
jgi:hypothetical protein